MEEKYLKAAREMVESMEGVCEKIKKVDDIRKSISFEDFKNIIDRNKEEVNKLMDRYSEAERNIEELL